MLFCRSANPLKKSNLFHSSNVRFLGSATLMRGAEMANKYKSERSKYEEFGQVTYSNVLPQELMLEVSDHVEWLKKKNPSVEPELLEHYMSRDDAFWIRLASDGRLVDIAHSFFPTAPGIALFATHYVCKNPGTGKPIHFHQDGSYWPLHPMSVVTLWLAVDKVDIENGCMMVESKSHIQGLGIQNLDANSFNDHVKKVHSGGESGYTPKNKLIYCEMNRGDVSVHHPLAYHGSNANTSNRRRCGLTLRYIPTTTKLMLDEDQDYNKISKGSMFLVRGESDKYTTNPYRRLPIYLPGKSFKFLGCEQWNDKAAKQFFSVK